ncbi:MAG: hypothetical protein LBF12_03890 [Christensenellaceae bacterium]|jgi:hypothetical protein|nr:hypothetical protein [Christensenellaceae bacterium]
MSENKFSVIWTLFVLICAIMILTSLLTGVSNTQAEELSTYYIRSESDFLEFAALVNGGDDFNLRTVELKNDIYLYQYKTNENYIISSVFKGNFEGNNHAIVGLRGNNVKSLFYMIGSDYRLPTPATVSNLKLVNFELKGEENDYAAALTQINAGNISNVKVYAKLSNYAAGISVLNIGTIQDSFVYIESTSTSTNELFAITYGNYHVYNDPINVSNYEYFGIINGVAYAAKLENDEEIEPLRGYFNSADSNNIQEYKHFSGSYLQNYEINDIFDYLYFTTLTDANVEVSQKKEINLYNCDFEIIPSNNYDSGNYGVYNAKSSGNCLFPTAVDSFVLEDDSAEFLSGNGTIEDPYQITSYEHLNKLNDLETANQSGVSLYYELANDIYLFENTTFYKFSIAMLNGVLDGAGYAMIGQMSYDGSSVIDEIGPDGIIKNLVIKTILPESENPLIKTNKGIITNVDFNLKFTSSEGKSVIGYNEGVITKSSFKNDPNFTSPNATAAIIGSNSGTVRYLRSEVAIPVVNTNTNILDYIYNEKSVVSSNTTKNITKSIENGEEVVDPTPYGDAKDFVFEFSSVNKFENASWGIPAGVEEDKITLTFYKDNNTYKEIIPMTMVNFQEEYNGQNMLGYSNIGGHDWYGLINTMTEGDDKGGYKYYLTMPAGYKALITPSTEIINRGEYRIDAQYEPDESFDSKNYTRSNKYAHVIITKKTITIVKDDYKDLPGVYASNFPNAYAKIYDGKEVEDSYFRISKILSSFTFKVDIVEYFTHNDFLMENSDIRSAGKYVLKLSAIDPDENHEIIFNFNPSNKNKENHLDFYIMRKEAYVTAYLKTIKYNYEIMDEDVTYTFTTVDQNVEILDEQFNKATVGFDTNYKKGNPVGSYNIKAILKSTNYMFAINYSFVAGSVQSFNVEEADIPGISSLVFNAKSVLFNGESHTIQPTNIPSGNNEITYTQQSYVNVGIYEYTIEITNEDKNYKKFMKTVTLEIKPVNLTVTVNSIKIKYLDTKVSDALFSVTYSAIGFESTPPGIDTSRIFTYAWSYQEGDVLGDYYVNVSENDRNVTFTYDVLANNYTNITFTAGVLTIEKGELDIILKNNEVTYSGVEYTPELDAKLQFSEYKEYITLEYYTLDKSKLEYTPKNAGEYTLKVVLKDMPLFIDYTYEQAIKIKKATLNLSNEFIITNSNSMPITIENDISLNYNGVAYGIDFSSTLKGLFANSLKGAEDKLNITYSAMFNNQLLTMEKEYTKTSGFIANPFSSINVGVFTEIKAIIKGDNYEEIIIEAMGSVSITPTELKLNTTNISTEYSGSAYSLDTANIKFDAQYGIMLADTLNGVIDLKIYSHGIVVPIDKMIDVSDYNVLLTIKNSNYEFHLESNNSFTISITKRTIYVDLKDVETFKRTYGDSTPLEYNFNYEIDENEFNTNVVLRVNSQGGDIGMLKPGSYDVIGTNIFSNVDFAIQNGIGKYQVEKLELSFEWSPYGYSWNLSDSYEYNGQIRFSKEYPVTEEYWTDTNQKPQKGALVSAKIVFEKVVKNAGLYTATLEVNSDYYTVSEDTANFETQITKKDATLVLNSQSIGYSDALPTINGTLTPNFELEGLGYVFTEIKFKGYAEANGIPGTYEIEASVASDNYNITVQNAYLTITIAEFKGLEFNDETLAYDILPYVPTIVGLPEDASVEYESKVLNVGIAIVKVKISKQYFVDKELEASITITPATVEKIVLKTDDSIAYSKGGLPTPSGTATFKETEVEGIFSYVGESTKKLGSHSYEINFTPLSSNYFAVEGLQYIVNSYVDEGDVEILTQTENDGDAYKIPFYFLIAINDAYPNAKTYLNGEIIESKDGFFEINEEGEYNIEVKEGEYTIYATTLKTKQNTVVVDPPNSGDDSTAGNNNTNNDTTGKKSIENILWISLGVLGGVLFSIVIGVVASRRRDQRMRQKGRIRHAVRHK